MFCPGWRWAVYVSSRPPRLAALPIMSLKLWLSPSFVFFLNDTPPPEISPLSLPDALPISTGRQADRGRPSRRGRAPRPAGLVRRPGGQPLVGRRGLWRRVGRPTLAVLGREDLPTPARDRKSTRLNSSHLVISYAVFCLKTK